MLDLPLFFICFFYLNELLLDASLPLLSYLELFDKADGLMLLHIAQIRSYAKSLY